MLTDYPLVILLILLGAMIAYALDEQFSLTFRLSEWLGKVLND